MIERVDYRGEIVASFDEAREMTDYNTNLWLSVIEEHFRNVGNAPVLDLGCGTGRFAIPMAQELGYRVIGADNSSEMLGRAMVKEGSDLVSWQRVDAHNLPYPDSCIGAVFTSHLFHHLAAPKDAISEIHRVLAAGEVFLKRYGAWEDVCVDTIHMFFPEAYELDKKRLATCEETEFLFREAGFTNVHSQTFAQLTYPNVEELFKAIEAKCTSVLHMIKEESFEAGLRKLRAYIDKNPNDPRLIRDLMTLTVGIK